MRCKPVASAALTSVAALIVLLALLASRSTPGASLLSDSRCTGRPSFGETTNTLAACLPAGARAADAVHLLTAWERINDEWGDVSHANVLPGGGPELLVRYHADLKEVSWNPQGKFVILQLQDGGWRVASEFDGAQLGIKDANGAPWTNWSYHILDTADLTGDGLEDVVAELRYSNGLHVAFRYLTLLTAHSDGGPSGLRVAYLEDTNRTRPAYRLIDSGGRKTLQSIIAVRDQGAITRTLAFTGEVFEMAGEEINPAASTVSARTPDGAQWYGFDRFDGGGGSSMYDPVLGLYRLKDGQLQHYDIPGTVRVLKVGPDGSLYVLAGLGVMRYAGGRWETLLNTQGDPSLATAPFVPFEIVFGRDSELWIAGIHSLAHFNSANAWTQIVMPARRLLVAPDGSVWTEGWDGRADSDCCFNHLTGSTWVTYTHSATLPVAPDLQERIRALQR
jgi:hypothetical protein